MQTFLPYPDFTECAHVLDSVRLRKQIVEGHQILATLALPAGSKAGWVNHPAVRMWAGYVPALRAYMLTMQEESRRRGFTSNLRFDGEASLDVLPTWLGNPLLHLSHKANLLRKDEWHYRPYFGDGVQPAQGYWWPIVCGPNSRKHTEMWAGMSAVNH